MGDVLPFQPRAPRARRASSAEIRAALEHALEAALNAADVLVARLDAMDADPNLEPGGDDEPSLASPAGGDSQVPWATGGSHDIEHAHGRGGRACLNPQKPETKP